MSAPVRNRIWTPPAGPPAGGLPNPGRPESYDEVMNRLSGKVHRWKFNEMSGYPQDSVGTLHMTTGGGTITYGIPSPTGVGMQFTQAFNGSGNGNAPMGNNERAFVAIVKMADYTANARTIMAYGPTSNTRQWNHLCLNHDGIDQGPCILFWSDDHKPGGFLCDQRWHMMVWNFAGRGVNTWADGYLSYYGTTGANLNTVNSGNLTFMEGTITETFDDFTIFNRWLPRIEIDALWEAVRPRIAALT